MQGIEVSKHTQRLSFPNDFILYELNLDSFRQALSNAPDRASILDSNIIVTIPNTDGELERFKMYEASNFTPDLQAQFPEIRSYVGIGIDDQYAQIRLSSAPGGIQSMIFRANKKNEFIEAYSADGSVYAVYKSSRNKGQLPFTCSTEDLQLATDLSSNLAENRTNIATYKTMRLAQSCTAEYSNYFGATGAAQVGLVLAAFNASMARVNGVFEVDFAVHLNIIAQSTNVIYYNAATDPYSAAATGSTGAWNTELQNTLSSSLTGPATTLVANNAAYDIGHLFGASGGGGNAGCIGCVCTNDTSSTTDKNKGSAFTSPADAIPSGDNFDIDYVAHEMGHQLGCNHTFSHSGEDNSVNVEPGSGSTIMGYAGITGSTDVQQHSDDYFTYRSILQTQLNLSSKTCPVSTPITHGIPTISAGADYTIPKSTPFVLTGTGSDPSGGPITFCWEENDDATGASASGAGSFPSPTKTNGPNYRSLPPVSVPFRFMPAFATVLNNSLSSTWEATSSVARSLNFTLTGRDNIALGGLTQTDAMVVTVSGTTGPFDVTSQNAAGVSWGQGSTQTIIWVTNGAETLPGSTTVDILLSTDGGATFPTVLATGVPNDGSQTVTAPSTPALSCRVMVKPTGNIYYDINTTPFAIGYVITTTCNTYSNQTGLPIPDGLGANNPGPTVTNSITVPSTTGTISDVNIALNVSHTWPNDLVVAIINPGGSTTVPVWNRACAGNDNFNVTFSDGSPALTCVANMIGTFNPSSPLAAFNGGTATGNWTLQVADFYNADTGTVNNWSVVVCTQTATLGNENFGLENFSIFPNPNNGNFNIKFNSTSANDIFVEVHDIRGRQIFNKTYQNTGLFEQSLNLNNAQSGIYLVTVKDGNKKEVKKIVIE
jgi:subtilisin-like proprotein convertase family protein